MSTTEMIDARECVPEIDYPKRDETHAFQMTVVCVRTRPTDAYARP